MAKKQVTSIWITSTLRAEQLRCGDQSFSRRITDIVDRYYELLDAIEMPEITDAERKVISSAIDGLAMDIPSIKRLDDYVQAEGLKEKIQKWSIPERIKLIESLKK